MTFFMRFVSAIALLGVAAGCATTSGTADGSTGSVGLSLELEENEFVSDDGYDVRIDEISLCLGGLAIGPAAATDSAAAEFAHSEAEDFYELTGVPAGDYHDLEIAFCSDEASLALEGAASSGESSCDFSILLSSLDDLELEAVDHIVIDELEETEVVLHFNAASFLEALSFADIGCDADASLEISESSLADVAEDLKDAWSASHFEAHPVAHAGGHSH